MSEISIKGIGNLLSNASSTATNSTKEVTTGSFDETLNNLRADNCSKQSTSIKEEKSNCNETDKSASDKNYDSAAKKLASTAKKDAVKKEQEPTNEQIAAMSEEIAGQIKEAIQQQYNISEEELSMVMDELGMSDLELLDTAEMTKLLMKLDGVESQADVLTNPDFAKNMKDIIAKTAEIKEHAMSDLKNQQTNMDAEEISVNSQEEPAIEASEEEQEQMDTIKGSSIGTEATDGQSDIGIGIEKSADNGANRTLSDESYHGEADQTLENQFIQPQDFANKLTEDLSARVGEKQAVEIVRQVVEQIQFQTKQSVTSMEMQLYPEHLGKVLVQVVSKDGNITAQIAAENEAAKNALESQLTLLKENLNNQGIKIENVEVTIASHAFEQNMQSRQNDEQNAGNSGRGKRAARILENGSIMEVSEETEKDIMEFRGNTVSYSA